jgi:hypothetical protein
MQTSPSAGTARIASKAHHFRLHGSGVSAILTLFTKRARKILRENALPLPTKRSFPAAASVPRPSVLERARIAVLDAPAVMGSSHKTSHFIEQFGLAGLIFYPKTFSDR